MKFTRRNTLKALGSATVVGGLGAASFSSSAAAITTNLAAANPAVVSNDDGNIEEVYVAPKVFTQWVNFDEAPLKLRYILHAGIEGTGFKPVYRETPWLFTDSNDPEGTATHGTTDRYPDSGRAFLLTRNSDFYNLDGSGNPNATPKIVLYKEGMGAYYDEAADYPDTAHWDGSSLGADSGDYANGNYGVLGDTSALDAPTDGDSTSTTIHLRLITALLTEDSDTVMQDEYPSYKAGGYTYDWLVNNAGSHPAISVAQTTFDVQAVNEQAESGSDGVANPGVN